jgi:hypothetical protein
MEKHLSAEGKPDVTDAAAGNRLTHDFKQQCLRVLRCTAQALAEGPGGLRFKAGTQPWLDALTELRGEVSLTLPNGV